MTAAPPLLLIEDTPSLQMVYRSVLTNAGYRVTTAGTAAEGMAAFRAENPQVILLDLVLPDRDGLDLMHDMLTERPDANVIVITANGSINKAVEAMRLLCLSDNEEDEMGGRTYDPAEDERIRQELVVEHARLDRILEEKNAEAAERARAKAASQSLSAGEASVSAD